MPTKFESMIMDQYLDRTYGVAEERPPLRIDITGVGDPSSMPEDVGPSPDDVATQMAAGTEPEGATPMTLGQFAATAADVPAGILKGGLTGGAGAAGDIISIVRGIYDFGASGGDFDALLSGMQKPTGLPTTEDLKKFLDETLGVPLVPKGADPRRIEAAKTAEFVGEIGGGGEAIVRGTKAAARAAGEIGREMATTPPRGSVQIRPTPVQTTAFPKYFSETPKTSKEIDRLTDALEKQAKDSGFQVKAGASNVSGSRYVTITKDLPNDEVYSVQVRISNHGDKNPGSLGVADKRFSIDPDTGNTLQDVLQFLEDEGFLIRKTTKREKKLTDSELAKKYGVSPVELKNIQQSRGTK